MCTRRRTHLHWNLIVTIFLSSTVFFAGSLFAGRTVPGPCAARKLYAAIACVWACCTTMSFVRCSTNGGTTVDGGLKFVTAGVGDEPTSPVTAVPRPVEPVTPELPRTENRSNCGPAGGAIGCAQLNAAVLTSGIYSFAGGAADLAEGGTLTLNGPGVFIFQVDSG